jgi:uncharacterized membrane protein
MLVSLMGFIMSALLLDVIPSWALSFMIVFIIMFVAAVISMSNVPFENKDLLEELNIHDPLHYEKKKSKSRSKPKKKK